MHIILCLDDRNGMMFHNRRQSRDRNVIQDVVEHRGEKQILIRPISIPLFQGYEQEVLVDENLLEHGKPGDLCFIEDLALGDYVSNIETITVYRWNRHYPADTTLDISLKDHWKLVSQDQFPGYSHEKITKEVYVP